MKKLDLAGKKFGKLFVIEEVKERTDAQLKLWKCLCDCGNVKNVLGTLLNRGRALSCGCSAMNVRKFHPSIINARRLFVSRYSDGDLTFEDFYEMSQKNCFYCGIGPSNLEKTCPKGSSEYAKNNCGFIYNGLDRVDSNFGHLKENCVTACKECNSSKRKMTLEDFYSMIKNISNINFDLKYNLLKENISKVEIYDKKFNRIKGELLRDYRDINFSFEIFCWLIEQDCFYCGRKPSNKKKCSNGDIILTGGLDRIDSSKPHLLENIVPCCIICNAAKSNRSVEEFISWANRVYNHLKL